MTFEKILVALDGSESGQVAADCAFWLADKLDVSLCAQHVVDPKMVQLFLDPEFGKALGFRSRHETEKKVFNALRKIGSTILDLFINEAHKRSVNVSTTLDEGSVADRIIEYSSKFDLLVIGHHGRDCVSSPKLVPLGSVAERVVLGSQIPVLIAVQPLPLIEQVIVAYDGSEASRGALLMSEDLAKRIGASLKAVVVTHPSSERCEAELLVDDGKKFLHEKWSEDVFSIKEGRAAEIILSETQSAKNTLLVLGAYGYADPEQNVLGSTTTKVIRKTASSVLIYRPKNQKNEQAPHKTSFAQAAI